MFVHSSVFHSFECPGTLKHLLIELSFSTENIEDTTICIKQEDIENIFLTGDDYDNRDIVKREKIKDYSGIHT